MSGWRSKIWIESGLSLCAVTAPKHTQAWKTIEMNEADIPQQQENTQPEKKKRTEGRSPEDLAVPKKPSYSGPWDFWASLQ